MKNTNLYNFVRMFGILGFFAGVLTSTNVWGATLLVYNTNDTGAGSLRQAVSDNNALGGGYSIVFSTIVTGTIGLVIGELLATRDVTIVGPGANVLTVSGNDASRIFHLTNSVVVNIS